MEQAALRHQMAAVVRVARDVLRDPTQASRLWGCTTDLCEVLEGEPDAPPHRAAMCVAIREDIRTGARPTDDLVEEIVWFIRAVEHDFEDEAQSAAVEGVVSVDQVDG